MTSTTTPPVKLPSQQPTDRIASLARHLREQAAACRTNGSPFYGVLLDHAAADVLADGATSQVLSQYEGEPWHDALAFRLLGTVHRAALDGSEPALAAHFPSTGGDGDAVAAWPHVRELFERRTAAMVAGLAGPPQTNEVGRSAPLFGGLLHAAAAVAPGLGLGADAAVPVRIFEVGTSGGLNLRADQFRYEACSQGPKGYEMSGRGPIDSPVQLLFAWYGQQTALPPDIEVAVIERVGADPAPLNVMKRDDALRLTSYVWPDQRARFARLQGAIELARRVPARLEQISATELARSLEPQEGALTVLWHSVMRQYLTETQRHELVEAMEQAGAKATATAPVAHISFEPLHDSFEPGPGVPHVVTVRTWPGGVARVLGEAGPHGCPVKWQLPTS